MAYVELPVRSQASVKTLPSPKKLAWPSTQSRICKSYLTFASVLKLSPRNVGGFTKAQQQRPERLNHVCFLIQNLKYLQIVLRSFLGKPWGMARTNWAASAREGMVMRWAVTSNWTVAANEET